MLTGLVLVVIWQECRTGTHGMDIVMSRCHKELRGISARSTDTSSRSSNEKTHAGVHRTENNHGRDHRGKLQTTVVRSSHASNDGLPNG